MPVAELIGGQPLQLGFIRLQQRLPQRLDILLDGRFVAGFGEGRRAQKRLVALTASAPATAKSRRVICMRFLVIISSGRSISRQRNLARRRVERKSRAQRPEIALIAWYPYRCQHTRRETCDDEGRADAKQRNPVKSAVIAGCSWLLFRRGDRQKTRVSAAEANPLAVIFVYYQPISATVKLPMVPKCCGTEVDGCAKR